MLRFDDLMAARILSRQLPERRDVLLAGLETLQEADGGGTQKSLLSSLVACNVLTMDQARFVFDQVQQYKRSRGLGILGHLVAREGVTPTQLKPLLDRLGPEGDMDALGDALVGAGLLRPERAQALRFQARLAFDRDLASQVQAYLDSRRGGAAASAPVDTSLSQIVRLPNVPTSQSGELRMEHEVTTTAEMAGQIVRGTLSDADGELPGPQFRIPSWVDTSDPRTGKQISGYRFLGRIGAGAMGVVYLVDSQDDPKKPIALKLLPKNASPEAKGRFKREILAQSFFSHPRVIDVYDAGETDHGYHYLAMEFFDGEDLEELLEAEKRFEPRRALQVARHLFEALGAAHEAGVIHRDVKPANMLVDRQGSDAKLMDFGIAVIRDLGEFQAQVFRSTEGGITGTPEYMSPEQASGDAIVPQSDLYSAGMVLYRMLSGRLPFRSETSAGYITCHMIEDPEPLAKADPQSKHLPRELHELLDRLFHKNPRHRPQSGAEVTEVLDRILPRIKDKRSGGGLFGFFRMGG